MNRHIGLHALRHVPCDPLEPHLASPNRVLVGRVDIRPVQSET